MTRGKVRFPFRRYTPFRRHATFPKKPPLDKNNCVLCYANPLLSPAPFDSIAYHDEGVIASRTDILALPDESDLIEKTPETSASKRPCLLDIPSSLSSANEPYIYYRHNGTGYLSSARENSC